MPILDASIPRSLIVLSSRPHSHSVVSLQSSLILGGTLPSKLGKFLSPFPLLSVLSSFHFQSVGLPFCVPLALERGIKWLRIGQEVGVSPWCRFQETCRARGKKERRKKRHDFALIPLLAVAFRKLTLSAFVLSRSVSF